MIRLENIKLPAKLKRTMASIKRAPVNLVSPSRNSADACAFFPLKSIRGSEPASGFRHSPLSAQRMCVVRQPEQFGMASIVVLGLEIGRLLNCHLLA